MNNYNLELKIKKVIERDLPKCQTLSSKQIAGLIDFQEVSVSRIKIRLCIRETIRKYNLPVGTNSTGYYWIKDSIGLRNAIDFLNSKIKGIEDRKTMVVKNYDKYYGE